MFGRTNNIWLRKRYQWGKRIEKCWRVHKDNTTSYSKNCCMTLDIIYIKHEKLFLPFWFASKIVFILFVQIILKNDRNGGIWQSGISKSLAEYAQRPVCFVHVQLSLHENVFSVCALMDNAAYIIFTMWNSISSLEP